MDAPGVLAALFLMISVTTGLRGRDMYSARPTCLVGSTGSSIAKYFAGVWLWCMQTSRVYPF